MSAITIPTRELWTPNLPTIITRPKWWPLRMPWIIGPDGKWKIGSNGWKVSDDGDCEECCPKCPVTDSGTIDVTFSGIDSNLCGCKGFATTSAELTMYESLDGTYNLPLTVVGSSCVFQMQDTGVFGVVDTWSSKPCVGSITSSDDLVDRRIQVTIQDDGGTVKAYIVQYEISGDNIGTIYRFFDYFSLPGTALGSPINNTLSCGGSTTWADGGTATVSIP